MTKVSEFEIQLENKAKSQFAKWHKVDLHNHSPNSYDYQSKGGNVIERTAKRIREAELSIVMFTDHEKLPDPNFISEVQKKSGKLILRGIELNVFIDAWNKPSSKVSKNLFFHLLIGFDPNEKYGSDYWIKEIYRKCKLEERDCGSKKLTGITDSVERLMEYIKDANAIVIPAHLHSTPNAFKSRSMDDIYSDNEFLDACKLFDALEVRSEQTAEFFDGQHNETNNLLKTCIWSSDAHEPEKIGTRACYVQMQNPTYNELKAALGLPFRTSLNIPQKPQSYIIGMQIKGQYFPDQWVSFSPHCNVLMGVKGSGKTSVLECLRFALGVEVPKSRTSEVNKHLQHILGTTGRVKVLVKRSDGAKVLIERSFSNKSVFTATFEDERREEFQQVESLQFPACILGWHEIEQAATDVNIRRLYMDTIAGKNVIRHLEEEVNINAQEVRSLNEKATNKYDIFKKIQRQINRLEERRKGLKKLTDENLIQMRNEYENFSRDRQQIAQAINSLKTIKQQLPRRTNNLLAGFNKNLTSNSSSISPLINEVQNSSHKIYKLVDDFNLSLDTQINEVQKEIESKNNEATTLFNEFSKSYNSKVSLLTPEQKQILASHQRVMAETESLSDLITQKNSVKDEIEQLLIKLIELCQKIVDGLSKRTSIRNDRVNEFNKQISTYGVRLTLISSQSYSKKYRDEKGRFDKNYKYSSTNDRFVYELLKYEYKTLLSDFTEGNSLIFTQKFNSYLSLFENDDLRIELNLNAQTNTWKKIDELSAGQRCTAIFPLLLKLQEGSLVVDQPEDNLDNRYIASNIAPVMLKDKQSRQIILTSHNSNLVVLSDAEQIISFESDGNVGRIEAAGFLATQDSEITKHVLDILDGGEWAMDLRYKKYGSNRVT